MNQEGVIKYRLQYTPGHPLPGASLRTLDAWRTLFFRLGLIGSDPLRYGGVGFGNVSQRLSGASFVITGSQTAHLPQLQPAHYSIVSGCDTAANTVRAEGPIAPSSESLTHDTVYRARPEAGFVFHVHAPVIWQRRDMLGLPATPTDVAYGTPAMAQAVSQLLTDNPSCRVFAMGGHEDGIVSFGAGAEEAGLALIAVFARALALAAAW